MKLQTLTLLMVLTTLPVLAAHEGHSGKHQMPDGTWMNNHEMEAPAKANPAKPMQVTGKTVTATVNGLVCDFCAQGITKTLLKQPGVADVQVDLSAKTVVVGFNDDKVLGEDDLKALLTAAGYDMTAYEVR